MTNKKSKTYTLAELKLKHFGKIGTFERDEYEDRLNKALLKKSKNLL